MYAREKFGCQDGEASKKKQAKYQTLYPAPQLLPHYLGVLPLTVTPITVPQSTRSPPCGT
jgi:hypothetical protein